MTRLACCVIAALAAAAIGSARAQEEVPPRTLHFGVTITNQYARSPQTGRIFVILTSKLVGEPRTLWNADNGQYIFSVPVADLAPGETMIIDETTPGFPCALSEVPRGRYGIQAILDVNPDDPEFGFAAGNGRSKSQRLDLDFATSGRIDLPIELVIHRGEVVDLPRVRYERIESRHVGRTAGHRVFVDVAVILPPRSVKDESAWNNRKFPVQYWIPAYGESARGALGYFQRRGAYETRYELREQVDDFVKVLIGSHTKNGHHMWVNSPNNGPWEESLMQEIIPYIEENYPIRREAASRYLVGHGAGGWAALSLMIDHPTFFGGVWATAPDPVDFHDFFGVDLYADPPQSVYTDDAGAPRSLAIEGDDVVGFHAQARLGDAVGPVSLLHSWEAAFGERRRDTSPARLFDRRTGRVSKQTFAAWARHDILGRLKKTWIVKGAHLQGKIHVHVGRDHGMRIQGSVENMDAALKAWGAQAKIEFLEGHDGESIQDRDHQERIQMEITSHWRERK